MREDADLAASLGVVREAVCFEDLPAAFVDWARDFAAMEHRIDADVNRRLRNG